MWGHLATCQCPLCHCIPRVFAIIRLGRAYPGFGAWVCDRLRLLEAECRDELQRRGPPPALPPSPAGEVAAEAAREDKGPATVSPPKVNPGGSGGEQQLFAKVKPPEPPSNLATGREEKETKEKEEPPTSPKEAHQVEVDDTAGPSSSQRKVDKSRSRRRRRETRSSERPKDRSRRKSEEKKPKRKRRSHSDSRRRSRSRRRGTERGRSRKRREEKPPEPDHPPPRHRYERPPEPPFPPPGRGWLGPLPVSNHPRWYTGTNKGQVRRAKQEIFNRRPRR